MDGRLFEEGEVGEVGEEALVRWRTGGAGKLSFLSMASTVRWKRR